jgi:sugar phosphate isomerase/epimerase
MGTPESDVFQAAELLSRIGYDGIEIICASDYNCAIHVGWSEEELNRLRLHLERIQLKVACVTPYLYQINAADPDARHACLQQAEHIIRMASLLQARGIRILAGTGVKGDRTEAEAILVDSLQRLSSFAEPYGVELWLENHNGSLADSAAATADLVKRVERPNVGIVYDQTNLTELHAEETELALQLQLPYIRHVHAKAKAWSDRGSKATLFGEGQVNVQWEPIIRRLQDAGYDGYVCYEYERRWAPDLLPLADTGMAHGFQYLSRLIRS